MRALLVLALLSGTAHAEEDPFFIERPRIEVAVGGALTLADELFAEAGFRPIQRLPLLVHAMVMQGRTEDPEVEDPMHLEWMQVRAGVELSACMEIACVFAMGDIGLDHVERVATSPNSATTVGRQNVPMVAGRFGIEFGRFMYARVAIDVVRARVAQFDTDDRGPPDGSLHVAIAMRF